MNILVCIDELVINIFKQMIFSVKQTNKDSNLNIYLVHENISNEIINEIKYFIEINNIGDIKFIKIDISNYKFPFNISHITKATYLRLYAPFFIDEELDRILYLDYDIVCTFDINNFYNMDFDNKTIIGVTDFYLSDIYKNINYINAGVLLIDIKKYKNITSISKINEYISKNFEKLKYQDQTVINDMFSNEIKLADYIYNYQINASMPEFDYASIVHYSSPDKPWNNDYKYPEKALPYYKNLYLMGKEDEAKKLATKHFKNQVNYLYHPERYEHSKTVDIIMPSYNATNTIRNTLNSIVEQELDDIKVTVYLIDDCSDEDYMPVVEEYKDKLDIKYFRLDRNSGVALARQKGIDEGNGDFFTIIDSDDVFISPYSIKNLYYAIMESNADVVRSIFFEEQNWYYQNYKLYRNDNIACHGKMYRKKFITDNNIIYLDMRGNEDTAYNALLKACNAKYHDINVMTYRWCYNPNSFTRKDPLYHETDLITYAQGFLWTTKEILKRKFYIDYVPDKIAELIGKIFIRIDDCWLEDTKEKMYNLTSKIYLLYRLNTNEDLFTKIINQFQIDDEETIFLYNFLIKIEKIMLNLSEYKELKEKIELLYLSEE